MSKLPQPPEGQRWLTLNSGRVAFLAPADYATHRERDETVAVYPPGNESGVTLRLSLHPEALQPGIPKDAAERFVTDHASDRALPPTRLPDRVYLAESREEDWPDRRVMMHFWQVGVGRIFVVISATVWGVDRESPTVRRALASVPQMIESLRLV